MGRLIDADKLKEHYAWWSGDRKADKELFDQIVDLQPTCNQLATDCINRQDAIDALSTWENEYEWDAWCGENWNKIESDIITPANVIAKLPSAQPTQTNTESTQKRVETTQDCISRQAAIDEIRKCRFVVDAIEKIGALPSVQPEIIRCKDCKFWTHIKRTKRHWCKTDDGLYDLNTSENDFCSRAERKTDE